MEKKKEKIGQIRRREILEAAKKVFLRKGFTDTVMEDIIQETSLSRGGVYYYYINKVDIMHDLMKQGIDYRVGQMKAFMAAYSGRMDQMAIAEMMVDKILDRSDLMSLYAMYLQAQKTNQELRALFPVLVQENFQAVSAGMKEGEDPAFQMMTSRFLIAFINTMILGCETLEGARDSFLRNRSFLVEILMAFIKAYENGKVD